jgi:outer membrane murein-binding lipoprotein Lpp
MKHITSFAAFGIVCTAGLVVAGCKDPNNIVDQAAAAKKMPPPTAEQMQKGWAQIAANHEKAKEESSNWAKTHTPEEVAKVNAARAAGGKPPLGQ